MYFFVNLYDKLNVVTMFDLNEYLRSRQKKRTDSMNEYGPVITISREYGCSAKVIAMALAKRLNKLGNIEKEWTWVNKEVFEGTAEALNLKKEKILHVFEGVTLSTIDNIILMGDDKYYRSDRAIKAKIVDIVRSFAETGNTIIIGLAGAIITRDIKKSLHIRLHAPFDWRANRAAKEKNKSIRETIKRAISIDRKRENLRMSFQPKKSSKELFDLSFNVMTMSQDEIVDTIVFMMQKRELI